MEFPELGKNCDKVGCNDLDFLPIKCQYCQKYFCTKHFLPQDHQCENYKSTDYSKDEGKTELPLLLDKIKF